MIIIDTHDTRLAQAKAVVRAAKKMCNDNSYAKSKTYSKVFEEVVSHLLASVLENEKVDEELASNIRLLWAKMVNAKVQ